MIKLSTLFLCAALGTSLVKAQTVKELTHISSYVNGVLETAEVVAYDADHKQVYFTSSSENKLTILDVFDVNNPTKMLELDLAPYGGGPNSVDYSNGIVAVAIENNIKTENGLVVFFDFNGLYLGQIAVGALPDMLTFTPNGNKIVVANEGEPSSDYTVDPEGSISVIDLTSGVGSATVTHITFEYYNDKKVSLQNKGIRIFGNNGNASVA